jgi:type VI secretion system secreted protein VgrG
MAHTLDIESVAIPVLAGRPALEPVRLSGHEGVNSLFEYELLLKTPDILNLSASGARISISTASSATKSVA